jgi:hypothetical protein
MREGKAREMMTAVYYCVLVAAVILFVANIVSYYYVIKLWKRICHHYEGARFGDILAFNKKRMTAKTEDKEVINFVKYFERLPALSIAFTGAAIAFVLLRNVAIV